MNGIKEFQAVVFDMDGVIFDSERYVIDSWIEVAKRHQIEGIEEVLYRCLGVNAAGTKAIFYGCYGEDFPYDRYAAEASKLYHEWCDGGKLPMKPGIVELLCALKEAGKKIALASSTRYAVVTKELTDAGIIHYFNQIICGDMVSKSKPEPDIYLKACELLEVAAQDAYAIEDSYNGIRSAHAAGLSPVMVPDLAAPTKEMEELARVILPSLTEVRKWMGLS